METKELIAISQKNVSEASFMSGSFTNGFIRNRIYLNVLGSEAFSDYLKDYGIEVKDIHHIHSIKRVVEKSDIADIILPNIHIDVRVIFDENKIFIPKEHFNLGIFPDIYVVLKFTESNKHFEFLGFISSKDIDINKSNDSYCFVQLKDLSSPKDVIDYIRTFDGGRNMEISDTQMMRGRMLSVALADHDISNDEYKEFLNLLVKSDDLRESVLEFDNFETLAYFVSQKFGENKEEENYQEEKNENVIADLQEENETSKVENDEPEEFKITDYNGDDMLDDGVGAGTLNIGAAAVASDAAMQSAAASEEAIELAGVAGDEPAKNELQDNDDIQSDQAAEESHEINSEEELITEDPSELTEAPSFEDIDLDDFIIEDNSEAPESPEIDLNLDNTPSENAEISIEESKENIDNSFAQNEMPDALQEEGLPQNLSENEPENTPSDENLVETENKEKKKKVETTPDSDISEEENNSEIDTNVSEDLFVQDSDNLIDFDENMSESLDLSDIDMEEIPSVSEEEPLPASDNDSDTEEEVNEDINFDETSVPEEDFQEDETPQNNEESVEDNSQEEIETPISEKEEETSADEKSTEHDKEEENVSESLSENREEDIADNLSTEDKTLISEEEDEENDNNSEINYSEVEDFSDFENLEPDETVQEEDNNEDISISDEYLNKDSVVENSTVISDKTFTVGEIPIDINKMDIETEYTVSPENENIEGLYDDNNIVDDSQLNNDVRVVRQDKKPLPIAIGLTGVALVAVITGAILFSVSKNNQTQDTPQPITGDNNYNQNTAQDPNAMNIDNNNVVMKDNNVSDVNQGAIQSKPSKQISATSFLSVRKISWEVPDYISYNANFRQYFQSTGKSLKSSLSSDLLLANDYVYSDQIRVSVSFDRNGNFKQSRLLLSSGSSQVDDIVLQSVNQTLNVLKAPNSLGNDESTTVILKIYL